MTNSPAEAYQWCLAHPTNDGGTTWDQWCARLVFRAGNFTASAPSAWYAAQSTIGYGHHLYTAAELPFNKIPAGWIVYFDIGGVDNGHVGFISNTGVMTCANSRVTPFTPAHKALGEIGVQDYITRSGARYMGASPYYINATLRGVGLTPADSGDTTPIVNKRKKPLMQLACYGPNKPGQTYYVIGDGLPRHFTGSQDEADQLVKFFGTTTLAWSTGQPLEHYLTMWTPAYPASSGGNTDLSATNAKIDAVDAKVETLSKHLGA